MSRYQLLKPETGDIGLEVWKKIRSQPLFWLIFSLAAVLSVFLALSMVSSTEDNYAVILVPFLPLALYIFYVYENMVSEFWKKLAEINGWEYRPNGNPNEERGLVFRQGQNRQIRNVISGVIEGRPFGMFGYSFDTGSGRYKKKHFYTVLTFKFGGLFPHIYLDSRKNFHSFSSGERIVLPDEFKEKFALSAPRKYEIEALQIFTPDILGHLSGLRLKHDIEFIDQEMIIFANGRLNNPRSIEDELNDALEVENLLEQKLDKIRFEPIGDMPYTL